MIASLRKRLRPKVMCPPPRITFDDVDGFDLMLMFRWFQRLVAIVLVIGFLVTPKATTRAFMVFVDHKAAAVTEQLMEGLQSVMETNAAFHARQQLAPLLPRAR